MFHKHITLSVMLCLLLATACEIQTAAGTATSAPIELVQPSSTPLPTRGSNSNFVLMPTPTFRLVPGSTPKPAEAPATPTLASHKLLADSAASIFFPVGSGFTDVIPHQIVRTNTDRVYIFAGATYSTTLRAFWTSAAGLPNSQSDFNGSAQVTESGIPMSVDAVYDGGNIIHVLVITYKSGVVKDYPFDVSINTWKSPITLATDSNTISGDYIGTSGVSGMVDMSGSTLHVVYWSNANHIKHGAFTYNSVTNTLTQTSSFVQVDSNGNANHPSIAISPVDNSLTVAWVYGAASTDQGKIAVRVRTSAGQWNSEQVVSTARAWTSNSLGINIDQGPSVLIDASGTKQLTYIENDDATHYYGHVHYVVNSGSGWIDQAITAYSHDPTLALNSGGDMYIIGHGHPQDPGSACLSMTNMCTIKKNGHTWNIPQLFATPPSGFSFDSSPSVKWSVVGLNRPESIEFLFFSTPYTTPTVYYGRLPLPISVPSMIYLPLIMRSS